MELELLIMVGENDGFRKGIPADGGSFKENIQEVSEKTEKFGKASGDFLKNYWPSLLVSVLGSMAVLDIAGFDVNWDPIGFDLKPEMDEINIE